MEDKQWQEMIKAMKFAVVGVANTLVDFGMFTLLAELLSVDIYLSQLVSFLAGTANSYVFNRSWTFKSSQKFWSPVLIRFLLLNLAMLLFSSSLLWLFYQQMGFHKLVAKACSVVISLAINFVINRLWVFRS